MMKQYNLNKYIELWGKKPQVLVAVEEMAELSKELLKDVNRNKDNREEIIEELADTLIMMEQLKIIYEIDENELDNMIDKKIQKLDSRVSKS